MSRHETDCGCDQCRRTNEYIERVLADAPPLTPAQRAKLAELLAPVRIRANKAKPPPVTGGGFDSRGSGA